MIPIQQSGQNPFVQQSNSPLENYPKQKIDSTSHLSDTYAAKAKEVIQNVTDGTDSIECVKRAE